MKIKSVIKYQRLSAFKARDLARHIQGMPARTALELLEFYPQKGARFLWKTLRSAMANAWHNHSIDPATLYVKEATVNEGPTLRRFKPRARGSASPIAKRTSHFQVVLDRKDAEESQERKTE